MERKVVFAIMRQDDGTIGYQATNDFEAKDCLTMLAAMVDFTMKVGQELVGLTQEEAEYNVKKAVISALEN